MKVIKLSCYSNNEDDKDFRAWDEHILDLKEKDIGEEGFDEAIAKAKKEWKAEEDAKLAEAAEVASQPDNIEQTNIGGVIDGVQIATASFVQGREAGAAAMAKKQKPVNIKNKNEKMKIKGAQITAGKIRVEDPEALKYLSGK